MMVIHNGKPHSALVSVVIPTYKRPDMIGRAVQSVYNQTYKNIEIIVVDDNGEGTEMQVETAKVMAMFPGVTYLIHEKNKGGSAARNTGWRVAKGSYITFLDDDDELADAKIEKQVAVLDVLDEKWGACYTGYHILMQNGKVQRSSTCKSGDVYLNALMRTLFMGSGSNLLLRKSAVDAVNGYDETFARNQDIEFMARVFERYKLAYVDEDLLTIHLEVRQFNRTFEFVEGITDYYLERFQSRINALGKHEQYQVRATIALERARVALNYKKYRQALKIVLKNNVNLLDCLRYACYLADRVFHKKSYGFCLSDYDMENSRIVKKLEDMVTNFLDRFFPRLVTSKMKLDYLRRQGVEIGKGTVLLDAGHINIDASRPALLSVGDYCKIASGVTVLTHDDSRSVLRRSYGDVVGEARKTVIGNNVFIGTRSTVLMGTHIGDHCIVEAGSVLQGSYPAGSVIAGNPAKVICSLDDYYRDCKERTAAEAKEYVKCFYGSAGRFPTIEEMGAFFPLYLERSEEALRKYNLPVDLSGDEEQEVIAAFLETEPLYESFEAFLDDCRNVS